MRFQKLLLFLLVTYRTPLYWVVPASAQLVPPPVPIPPNSDVWVSFELLFDILSG
jgi:hypothetical protein